MMSKNTFSSNLSSKSGCKESLHARNQWFYLLVAIFYSNFVIAQEIQIKNQITGVNIEHVFVYNSNQSISTHSSEDGKFKLNLFSPEDTIYFQHPSYYEVSLSYNQIKSQGVIYLIEHIIEMEELVVSANKWEELASELPNSIISVKAKQIEFQNPQTSADLLQSTGKVYVQKSQQGGGSPMIRGFSANSVLIVIDGVRLNNAIFRSGNLQNIINIDPAALASSEVIFGPGSVIYGSDALGGVMDFHTKTGQTNTPKNWSAQFTNRYSSANNEKTSNASFSLKNGRTSVFTHFSYSNYGDLRTGSKFNNKFPDFGKRFEYVVTENGVDKIVQNENPLTQKSSGFMQYGNITKVNFRINDHSDLGYGFYFNNTGDIPRYDRLTQYRDGKLRYAEWNYGPQKWLRNSLTYSNKHKNKYFNGMKVIITYQIFDESRHTRYLNSDEKSSRHEGVQALNLNMDFNKITEKWSLFYGTEIVTNSVKSTAYKTDISSGAKEPASTRYPDGRSIYNTLAAYANQKYYISKNSIINYGLRLNFIQLNSRFTDKTFFDFPFESLSINNGSVNGNLGWVYTPVNGWKFDFLVSSGFRAPNVDDAGKLFDSEPYNIIVPNPNLKPENVYNIDIGIQKLLGKSHKMDLTMFYSYLDNVIVRRNYLFNGQDSIYYEGVLSRVQALQNAESAKIYGLSYYYKGEFSRNLAATFSYTYTYGRDSENFPVRHVSPMFGNLSIEYSHGKIRAEVFSHFNGGISFEDLAPSEQNKAYLYTDEGSLPWYTLNIRGSYFFNKNFSAYSGVENILDKNYRPYSSGISAPGINFYIALKIKL